MVGLARTTQALANAQQLAECLVATSADLDETARRQPDVTLELRAVANEVSTALQTLREESQQLASRLEAAWRTSDYYQNIFERFPQPCILLSPDGALCNANREAMKILHAISADRPVSTLANLTSPACAARDARHLQRVIQTGETLSWQSELALPSEQRMPVEIIATPLKDSPTGPQEQEILCVWLTSPQQSDAEERADILEHAHRILLDKVHSLVIAVQSDFTITQWNAEAERILGFSRERVLGCSFHDIGLDPDTHALLTKEISSILENENPQQLESKFSTQLRTQQGKLREIQWCICSMAAPGTCPNEIYVFGRDITEQAELEHQRMLVSEIEHRIKNSMATVLAIADQTLTSTASTEAFITGFRGRILALARMHALLAQSKKQAAPLRTLVEQSVTPYLSECGPHATIQGDPSVMLTPNAAQTVAMTLHELATNAAKYGALSRPSGWLEVKWNIQDEPEHPCLHFTWREFSGPPVQPPTRRGFGMELIEHGIAHDLQGESKLNFDPQGLQCSIRIPWTPTVGHRDDRIADQETQRDRPPDVSSLSGRHVLIVEDSQLVARELERMLGSLGCHIVGSVATLDEAFECSHRQPLDAVLLDINLNGVDAWPLADDLLLRNVPFILITGYACPGNLPPAFRSCLYLEKPFDQKALKQKLLEAIAQRTSA